MKKQETKIKQLTQEELIQLRSVKQSYDNIKVEFGEIAQIETKALLEELKTNDINAWYVECVKSNKWKRWQTNNFNLDNKEQVILVCGHYTKSSLKLPNFDSKIKKRIKEKLQELYEATI